MKHLALATALVLATARIGMAQQASTFSPSVTIYDSVATCEALPPEALRSDEKGYMLRFGSDTTQISRRVVSAVWDGSGHVRRYSDTRGDLRGPPVAMADR